MSFLFEQLPLAVQLRDDTTFENFYLADNGLLVNQLRQQLKDGERYIYLYGAVGCGRSHLLQAACHQADKMNLASIYMSFDALQDYCPEALFEGLEQLSLVCLDDIQLVMGRPEWEQQLFYLFNCLNDNNVTLLISSNCAVRELNTELPDLASRLSWGSVYQMKHLTDQQRIDAVCFRASKRGLELTDEVAQFIFHRCQRDIKTLISVLDRLDQASLKEQRRLTIPFVKATMEW
ncbi:MAG: DnaA regulatory inactivator Hda [Pseudomonadales bacterium]